MPNAEHKPRRRTTRLLEVKRGGTELALPAVDPDFLVAPTNRESDARAGSFEVAAAEDTPPDFVEYSARFAAA